MERKISEVRKNWEQKLENLGFGYHSLDGLYWDESHYYEFSLEEVNRLENATAELWQMCLAAVDYVIEKNLWFRFNIPEFFRNYILQVGKKIILQFMEDSIWDLMVIKLNY